MTVPAEFARCMIEVHGALAAEAWLAELPTLIAECAARWNLTVGPPFAELSYNYVAPAVRRDDGSPVVLKLGVPGPEVQSEIAALRWYDGCGIVPLLAADDEQGAFLIPRLLPGAMLSTLFPERDEEATTIAASLMRQLWRPAPTPEVFAFPTVAEWAGGLSGLRERFDGGTGPLPSALVEEAESLFTDLLVSSAPPVLLHGDLHHFNILTNVHREDDTWTVIDPKGLIGEPAYDVGTFLRNPSPDLAAHPDARRITARRVHQLSEELGLERARVRGWGLAQAVLSAWWSVEGHGHASDETISYAEHIAAVPV